jgi:phosphonate transport system substrate-binding protein
MHQGREAAMTVNLFHKIRWALALLLLTGSANVAAAETYSFSVVPLRSAVLTAQYWNPILEYVSGKAGVNLELQIARGVADSAAALERGDYDFNYSYLIFRPKAQPQKYKVILQPRGDDIRSQLVTLSGSSIKSLKDLEGREVGFPSRSGFIAYALPMDYLLRQKINVKAVFGGNQEGILGQLKAGQVVAAGVSSQVMKAYAVRENMAYKVIWESPSFNDLPIAVHPRIPAESVKKVQTAFVAMSSEAEGIKVLEAAAQAVGQKPPYGFIKSSPADYRQFVDFYHKTLVKDLE